MSRTNQTWPESWNKYFEYLDTLRKSGVTNMFGATDYLEVDFGLDHNGAKEILVKWMKTFAKRHPDGDKN